MGCDIHLYIEHKAPGWNTWSPLGKNINPGRNYGVFSRMAGVRSYGEGEPVVKPRGMPEDAGWHANYDNWLFVSDEDGEGCRARDKAERWVASGASRYRDERKTMVSHPDWHSHSWLTASEFAAAIADGANPEYRAILATMRSLEAEGHAARVVFWFDN